MSEAELCCKRDEHLLTTFARSQKPQPQMSLNIRGGGTGEKLCCGW